MKTKHILLGGAALAAVALALYARSSSGAKSNNEIVKWTRSKLVAAKLVNTATAPAAAASTVSGGGPAASAADIDDEIEA